MHTIRQWLEQVGLPQYAEVFERNAVDLELLCELTDEDLAKVGIDALGHRKRLLKAMAELNGGFAPTTPPIQKSLRPQESISSQAERRQLTVMFCDLVGSTALSHKLDPEDLGALMQAYRERCRQVVERYGGHVAQYLGDGVMVYFGWPQAHEDDVQRSMHAALEIVDAIHCMRASEPLQVRIGITTGPVVIGETGAGDSAAPRLAVGETPNLAARLQGLAGNDEVVIGATTHALAGGSFVYKELGEHSLKGVPPPVRAWRVLGQSGVEGRFEAAHGAALTPLVGRDSEMGMLLDCWHHAAQGAGRVVLLCGEPGIGKSRTALELCRRLAQSAHYLLRYQCSPYNTNSAFFPMIAQLEAAAGFERSDAPLAKLDKLDALLAGLGPTGSKLAPAYAALLSLPLDRFATSGLSATKQKENITDALVAGVIALSASKPVLMIFEDAHWVDPTTLETLSALVDGIGHHPVLLVIAHRPEFTPPWAPRSHVSVVQLGRLSPDQSACIVATVAGGEALPTDVLNQIVAKTDGVPLFVEEVTKSVLASQILERAPDRPALARPPSVPEIPATLKDLLMARLDQLGEAKKIAQIGAVLGRQFSHAATAALFGSAGGALARALQQLVLAGLVSQPRTPSDTTFTFRHALIQDAAYESLLKSERQTLHRRAGDFLSEQFPETAESAPELLARHYTAGNVHDRAVQYWLKAGQKAWQRSAAKEAIAHLSCGLELVDKVADAATRDALELRLQATLGRVYFATVSYAAPQAQAAFLRAHELCERVRQADLLAPVLYGIGAFQTMRGDVRAGHAAFEKLMVVAKAANQPGLLLYTHAVLTWSNYNQADYRAAIGHADHVIALYAAARSSQGPRLSAADPRIISEAFRALALWSLGFADQAEQVSDGLLAHARALGDAYSLAYALNFAGLLIPDLCGEHQRAVDRADEGIRLARELGYPFLQLSGALFRVWPASHLSDPAELLDAMDKGLEKLRALGSMYHYPHLLARRARLLIRLGCVDEAQVSAAEGLALIEQSGERAIEPDAYQAKGDSLQAAGAARWREAEACYVKAIEVARKQLAKGWELRVATALAQLWQAQGRRKEARDLLAPIYNWFTEGFATKDLKEAKALLDELSQ